MPIHNLSEQPSLIDIFVSELRDLNVQGDRLRFRRNIERIGEIIAYEVSKTLKYKPLSVQTPLDNALTLALRHQPVLSVILRAGLPLHQGFLSFFDKADNAFLSAYRKHDTTGAFEIALEYIASADFTDRTLILCDPMIATGQSVVATLNALLKISRPDHIHIACVIGSTFGIEAVQKAFPMADIWAAAIDNDLDKNAYIVPGLGDAGDLSFGEKSQK